MSTLLQGTIFIALLVAVLVATWKSNSSPKVCSECGLELSGPGSICDTCKDYYAGKGK